MLAQVACPPADWIRLAAALESAGSPQLANYVRAGLVFVPRPTPDAPVALAFEPTHAVDLHRIAAVINVRLDAAPVAEPTVEPEWVTTKAERAAAVAAADALVRAHRRHHSAS